MERPYTGKATSSTTDVSTSRGSRHKEGFFLESALCLPGSNTHVRSLLKKLTFAMHIIEVASRSTLTETIIKTFIHVCSN
ncbi:hypothetical protein PHBOTO_002057 [Pseudozyma hubeiensis]|nr:hypothetical protein PHBOTO_002057 [Pseudozyma hubeiensis]